MKSNFASFLFSDMYIYAAVFLSVVFVCRQLVRGEASLVDAIMVLMLGYGFFASIRQLMNSAHQSLLGVAAAESVSAILEIDTARPGIPFDGAPLEQSLPGIFVEGVSYDYPGRTMVIRNLSMTALYELCPPFETLLKTDADTAEAFKNFEAAYEKTIESVNFFLQNPSA